MNELGLRYILSNPAIHTVIPGAQTPEEVEANFRAGLKGPLPERHPRGGPGNPGIGRLRE